MAIVNGQLELHIQEEVISKGDLKTFFLSDLKTRKKNKREGAKSRRLLAQPRTRGVLTICRRKALIAFWVSILNSKLRSWQFFTGTVRFDEGIFQTQRFRVSFRFSSRSWYMQRRVKMQCHLFLIFPPSFVAAPFAERSPSPDAFTHSLIPMLVKLVTIVSTVPVSS